MKLSSFEQFKKDFLDFPFSDTDDVSLLKNINFNILHISSWRSQMDKYFTLLKIIPYSYITVLCKFFGVRSKSAKSLFDREVSNLSGGMSLNEIWRDFYLNELKKYENQKGRRLDLIKKLFHKIFLIVFCIIVVIFNLVFLTVLPLFMAVVLSKVIFSPRVDLRGFYSFYKSEKNLYVVSSKDSQLFEPVISHEHIHLLQDEIYKSGSISVFSFNKESINQKIFNESKLVEYSEYASIAYLFSPLEIEARLHEVLLTYYRKTKVMPKNRKEFGKLIFNFKFLSLPSDDDYENLLETRFYSGVEAYFIQQLVVLNSQFHAQFLGYVLPIFYRRLLTYYRATELIAEFDKDPPDRSLFDKLYISD